MNQVRLSYSRILIIVFFILWLILKGAASEAFLISCMSAMIVSSLDEINNVGPRYRWMIYSFAVLFSLFVAGKIYVLISAS